MGKTGLKLSSRHQVGTFSVCVCVCVNLIPMHVFPYYVCLRMLYFFGNIVKLSVVATHYCSYHMKSIPFHYGQAL